MDCMALGAMAGSAKSANMPFKAAAKSPKVSTMVPSRSTMAAWMGEWVDLIASITVQ